MMEFDKFVNNFLAEAEMGRRGRPKRQYVPSEKAHEVNFAPNSIEAQIINFLEEKPATLDELVAFLQQSSDEYYKPQICKEKIRQMLLDDILDFSTEMRSSGEAEYGTNEPELDTSGEDYYDTTSYLPPGALRDWEYGQPGHH